MTDMSIITNNNIEKKQPIAVTTTNDTAVASTPASTTNCIYDKTKDEAKVNEKVSSEIDKILEKVCEKYKKYGITVEQLKQIPLIQDICKAKDEDLAKFSNSRKQLSIEQYVEALETAIQESVKDGKVNIDKVSKLSRDYFTALSTGWTIKGFKEAQSKPGAKHSLMQRLVASGCLPKGATLENTSPEQLKDAVSKFYKTVLAKEIKKLRYAKTENGHKAGQPLSIDDQKKSQLQTFGRLLINSTPEEKEFFVDAIKHLYAENKLDGLKAIFNNCENETQRQAVAAETLEPANLKTILSEKDANGNVLSQEEATELVAFAASKQTEENREASHAKSKEAFKQWFVQNGDALKAVQEKVAKAKAEGVEPNLTEEEKQVLVEYENYVTAGQSGEFIGTQLNDKLSKIFKEAHMAELNRDAYEMPSYRDVLNNVNTYVENHPETFTPEAKEQFNTAMDKATNGNYTTVKTGSDAELKAPAKRSEDSVSNNADLGFASKKPVDSTKLVNLKSKISTTEEKTSFKVDKNVSSAVDALNAEKLKEKFETAITNRDKLNLIDKYFAKSTLLQEKLKQYVSRVANPLFFLNSLPTVARKHLSHELAQAGKLKEEDIQKLNLAYSEKQMLLAEYQESQKEKQEV